jgi:flagellar protein FlbD
VNCELIKFIESTPDTLITLTTGEKLMVTESVEAVIEATMNFRKRLYQEKPAQQPGGQSGP